MQRFLPIFFVLFFMSPPSLFAEIPWKPMLQGLLQRQYYDVALEYLESLRRKDDVPEQLKEQIDYLTAKVHLDAIAQKKTPFGLETHLNRAKSALQRFLQEHPDTEEAYQANRDLAQLLVDEVRNLAIRIHSPQTDASQKEVLQKQAGEKIDEAFQYFQRAERIVYYRAKEIQSDPSVKGDPAKSARRDATYMQVLESRILLAALPRERAQIYAPDSEEFQLYTAEAAEELHKIVQKYRNYSESLEAKLLEAKSLFDLKHYSQARILAQELSVLTDSTPQFRNILAQSFQLIMELNLQEPTSENLADSIGRIQSWTEATAPAVRAIPFFAKTNLLAGKTYVKYAEVRPRVTAGESQKFRNLAIEFFKSVASGTPEAQEVIPILSSLGDTVFSTANDDANTLDAEPTSFYEAKILAEKSFQEFTIADQIYRETTDQQEKQKRDMNRTRIAEHAISCFHRVFILKEKEDEPVDENEINAMRLKLAMVFWKLARWENVMVLGEFLMKHYPDTVWGPRGAELSIKAARQLFLDEKKATEPYLVTENPEHESTPQEKLLTKNIPSVVTRIDKTYRYIAARFPTQPVAQDALSIRIETELGLGHFEQAIRFLDILRKDTADDADKQAGIELNFGCALWDLYTRNRTEKHSGKIPHQKEHNDSLSFDIPDENHENILDDFQKQGRLLEEAQHILEKGLQAKKEQIQKGSSLDFLTISSSVVLAQIFATKNNPDAALEILEDSLIGPLRLLRLENSLDGLDSNEKHFSTVVHSPQWTNAYKAQIYAAALRVALETKKEHLSTLVPELTEHLDALFADEGNDDTGVILNTLVYFGQLLDAHLQSLKNEKEPAGKAVVESALEKILHRTMNNRSRLNENSLLWYADTMYRFGTAHVNTTPLQYVSPPEEMLQFFREAQEIYAQQLRHIDAQNSASRQQRGSLRFRLALAYRATEQFDEAYEILVELLTESENELNVQIEAARTLELRGMAQPEHVSNESLIRAIVGDHKKPDGQYLVWGWNGIIRRVSPHVGNFMNEYFQSYHDKIVCRILLSRNLSQEESRKMIQGAKNDLTRLKQFHPTLGGPDWQEKFNRLEKQLL